MPFFLFHILIYPNIFVTGFKSPWRRLNPKSLCAYLMVMPLPQHWPVWAAHYLLEKEGHPFFTPPLCNLFPMEIRYLAQDQSEDQIESPLMSILLGIKTIAVWIRLFLTCTHMSPLSPFQKICFHFNKFVMCQPFRCFAVVKQGLRKL